MKINVINKSNSFKEPDSGSVILTKDGDYHLVINLEHGFCVYELHDNMAYYFDDFDDYKEGYTIKEIFKSDEIEVTFETNRGED